MKNDYYTASNGQKQGLYNDSLLQCATVPASAPTSKYDYERIAREQQLSAWAIMLCFFCWFVIPQIGNSSIVFDITGNELLPFFATLAIYCFSIVCTVRLGRAILCNAIAIVLFAIGGPTLLVVMYLYANSILICAVRNGELTHTRG
jgi:hypothetical protein